MFHHNPFVVYNLLMGVIAAIGLMLMVYEQMYLVKYRRFLSFLVVGFLLFSIGGPLTDLFAPRWVHAIHGLAALFVIYGLYDPIHNDLRKEEWMNLLFRNPSSVRSSEEWMRPMDDRILELFHSTHLVLTPAIIAYNIDYSSKEVNRRLSELSEHGFVERVERGKYQLTELGKRYLEGELVESDDSETAPRLTNR